MNVYHESGHDLPVTRDVDVIVIGGGTAGLAAAIAAARNGAKTLLVEKFAFLGGTATASLMACINGFRNQVEPDGRQVIRGLAEEITLAMKDVGGLYESHYQQKRYPTTPDQMAYSYVIDTEKFKYVTMKTCAEAGVELLVHTWFSAPIMDGSAVKGVIVENKSGRQALLAKVVIDASGDADVAARAGVPYRSTDLQDPRSCPENLMYRIEFDRNMRAENWESLPHGCHFDTNIIVFAPWAKLPCDAVDGTALSQAEVAARLNVFEDFAQLRDKFPLLAGAKVVETAPMIGIRQSRFIEGEYTLTEQDILEGRRFPDAIALCVNCVFRCYGYRRYLDHDGYDIPYRIMLPRKVDNLLVTGRCMSGQQVAFESFRGMVIMMAVGQAAGTAAALAVRSGQPPRNIDVSRLQNVLLEQNAVLRKLGA